MTNSSVTEDPRAEVRIDLGLGGADPQELSDQTVRLRQELLRLDVERVEPIAAGTPPAGTRAVEVFALGSLAVTLVRHADVLAGVVRTLQGWLARDAKRSIKLEIDGDSLEVTGVSSQAQERLISTWLARHARE